MNNPILSRLHGIARTRGETLRNREAIKAVMVMPFLASMGYDPFDPDQVEAAREVNGEVIDFTALSPEGEGRLFLNLYDGTYEDRKVKLGILERAMAEEGGIGLLTDGKEYTFHVLDEQGGLDEDPVFMVDLLNTGEEPAAFSHLKRENYDTDTFVKTAINEVLPALVRAELVKQFAVDSHLYHLIAKTVGKSDNPSDRVYAAVEEVFGKTLESVLGNLEDGEEKEDEDSEEDSRRVITGDEEAAFLEITNILQKYVDPSRIHARPAQTYLACLLDDNNRKTICRLYFSAHSKRYVETFVGKKGTKHRINGFQDVVSKAEEIIERLRELDPGIFAVKRDVEHSIPSSAGEDFNQIPAPVAEQAEDASISDLLIDADKSEAEDFKGTAGTTERYEIEPVVPSYSPEGFGFSTEDRSDDISKDQSSEEREQVLENEINEDEEDPSGDRFEYGSQGQESEQEDPLRDLDDFVAGVTQTKSEEDNVRGPSFEF